MKDLTVSAFCRKFGACQKARKWAYNLTENKSKEKMSVIWVKLTDKHEWFIWTATCIGVLDEKQVRLLSCKFVRETPLADGRKVWDLLTDDRSKNAVVVAERFANGEATAEELDAASDAAWDAASDAAWDAARDAASDAAWYAASAAASAAAWYAASAAARDATSAAAWYAAWDAARDAQAKIIASIPNPFVG